MKRNYVVGVKSPSDWEYIHTLLTQDGTLEDNIPVRSCCCVDEKLYSPTRSTYLLAEEEVDLLKSHDKVAFVELDYTYHGKDVEFQNHFPKFEALGLGDTSRFQNPVKVYRSIPGEVPYPPSQTLTSAELNRTNWGLLRSNSREDPWKEVLGTSTITFAEYGTANVDHNWQVINFSGTYTSPVVVASDPSYNGAAQASVRIRNVNTTTRTFEISIQETSDLDNIHVLERIHWVVMESGCYQLPNGSRFSAGTINTNALSATAFTTVNFTESIGTDVHVISQVMTNNEAGWLTTRVTNITDNSFQIAMQEEQLSNTGTHAIETVGWIAFNNSVTNDGNTKIESGTYTLSIADTTSNFSFSSQFLTLPSLFAKIGSNNGTDPANVRITSLTTAGFSAFILEDLTADTETTHTLEDLTFLVLENQQGSLEGIKVTNPYYLFAGTPRAGYLLDTPKYFSGQDGSGTDCVIVDNGVWLGHPEFVNDAGISQVRDVILDGPYYIDPDYFISTGQTTIFLGRLTCTDQAAINWWTNSSLRSTQFQSIGTIPGLSVNNYSRALVCGDYSQLPTYTATYPSFSDHGTACASLMYGKNFGWAFNSNKWTITQELGGLPGLTIIQVLEVLVLFHDNKPRSSENKIIPSIISNSWGATNNVASQFSITGYYQFRNGTITSFTNKTSAPQFLKNFEVDNNSRYQRYLNPASFSSFIIPGDELLNKSGVYYIVSAGNENQKQVNPGDLDYNNWWSNVANPLESQKEYVNRRGYPAQLGYQLETNSYRSISVGSLSVVPTSVINGLEYIDGYSNSGPAIDVISPGNSVLAANSTYSIGYPRWDDNNYYTWLNRSPIEDVSFTGTSAACPVAAGLIASVISTNTHWTPNILKSYISNLVENQTPTEFLIRGDIASVTDENSATWIDRFALYDQEPKILYNAVVPTLQLSQDLPASQSIVLNEILTLSVSPNTQANALANSYQYQWQIKFVGDANFSDISGETNSIFILQSTTIDYDGAQFRCIITSDGPYTIKYSQVLTLGVLVGTLRIDSQPVPNITVTEGESVQFSLSASLLDVEGSISYQWGKINYNDLSPVYQEIPGATSSTYSISSAQVIDSADYNCVLTNSNSINSPLSSNFTTLVVDALVFINIISQPPVTQTIVEGGDLSLSIIAEVVGLENQIVSYQWQKRNTLGVWTNILGANSPTYSLTGVSLQTAGEYRCILSNSNSKNSPVISSVSTVVITSAPVITIISQPSSLIRLSPRPALFNVVARTGTSGNLFYQWQKSTNSGQNWNNLPGQNSSSLNFSETQESDSGLYRCQLIDNLATNSPLVSNSALLQVYSLSITQQPQNQNVILNTSASFSVVASSTSGNELLYQWQKSTNNGAVWENILNATSNSYSISSATQANLGLYRCRIIDPADTAFPKFSNSAQLSLIIVTMSVVSHPQDSKIYSGGSLSLSAEGTVSNGQNSLIQYQWQKQNNLGTWGDLVGETNTTYTIDSLDVNDLGFYRCKLSYALSYQSPIFTNSAEVSEDQVNIEIVSLPSGVSVYPQSQDTFRVPVSVESNYPELLNYQWQQFNVDTQQWDNLVGETNDILILDKTVEENYLVRCVVSALGTTIVSNEVFINIENLQGRIFREECGFCVDDLRISELYSICFDAPIVDTSCSREDINTCGIELQSLISLYPFYNYQRGSFKSWGDISYPWEISSLTPNLLFNTQNNQWKVANYSAEFAYFVGDRVLLIEEDGYKISLYEATQNILAVSGAFDITKWKKLCHIRITEPIFLPTIAEIKNTYSSYKLDFFLDNWNEYSKEWSSDLQNQSINYCSSLGGTIEDFQKCIKNNSSDVWNISKVRKEFFYRRGDIIAQEGECGDILCLYVAVQDIPATEQIFEQRNIFNNKDPYWQKIYCVSTGGNKCLGIRRNKEPKEGYEVLELGSKGHYVESPIPYSISPKKLLNDLVSDKNRNIPTPYDILNIEGKEDRYRQDCQ